MRIWVEGQDAEQARRIVAALRRGGLAVADAPVDVDLILTLGSGTIMIGDLRIDRLRRIVWRRDRRLSLTPLELALLLALAENAAGLDRPALLARVWHRAFDPGTNLVAVHVHRLRAKIGRERIVARPGGGYRLC